MSVRTIGQVSLIIALCVLSGWGADTDPGAFKDAKAKFLTQMRRRAVADRVAAITEFAKFNTPETADQILKRAATDAEEEVSLAAQRTLRKMAEDEAVRKHLFDELKTALKKPAVGELAGELFRSLACIEDPTPQAELLKLLDDFLASKKGKLAIPITLIDDFAKQGDLEAFRAILFFSKSKAFDARFGYKRCIVQAMTKMHYPEAVTWLILHLPQTTGLIQYDIVQYLTKLTSQKFGDNDREWYKWWNENKDTFAFPKGGVPAADIALNDRKPTYYGIPICAKRIVFVLDTSGSMRGDPMIAVKAALLNVVEQLPEAVNFDVVFFDRTATVWQPRLVPATTAAKDEVGVMVRNRGLGFGTASFAGLEAAFNLEPEAIYFLSDGKPTDSQPDQIFKTFYALNRTRRVSLHTIGVVTDRGNAAELILFMKPLAEQNFGTYRLVD